MTVTAASFFRVTSVLIFFGQPQQPRKSARGSLKLLPAIALCIQELLVTPVTLIILITLVALACTHNVCRREHPLLAGAFLFFLS